MRVECVLWQEAAGMVRMQLRVIDGCRGQVAGSVGAASRASSGAAEAREALKLAYEAYSGKEIEF